MPRRRRINQSKNDDGGGSDDAPRKRGQRLTGDGWPRLGQTRRGDTVRRCRCRNAARGGGGGARPKTEPSGFTGGFKITRTRLISGQGPSDRGPEDKPSMTPGRNSQRPQASRNNSLAAPRCASRGPRSARGPRALRSEIAPSTKTAGVWPSRCRRAAVAVPAHSVAETPRPNRTGARRCTVDQKPV